MIVLLPDELSTSMRVWWARNRLPDLPNDDRIWWKEWLVWLADQGVYPASDIQEGMDVFYWPLCTENDRQLSFLMLKYLDN